MAELERPFLEEYNFSISQVDDTVFNGKGIITYSEVLKAHFLIASYFRNLGEQVRFGVMDFNLLGSALGRQTTGYGGISKWTTYDHISATLFYGIAKNHSFHDANKRTALLTLIFQLLKYGRSTTCGQKELDLLAVRTASNKLNQYNNFKKFKNTEDPEIEFFAYFIRRNTREVDKKYYPVTYQEFNRLLNRFDIFLENPHGNYIDVIKKEEIIKKGIFSSKKEIQHRRIFQIGFPGWKSQVGLKAQKEVLKAANLTAEHGFDSQVFFKEAEPLEALIAQYSEPLKRLKDR